MEGLRLLWNDYRYFPYERMLAEREARLFFGDRIRADEGGFVVEGKRLDAVDPSRLTYFRAARNGTSFVVPDQAKLEASGNSNGLAWDPTREPIPSIRRQSTRYSAHGLHEYRGKFNPQVVRAIGNLFGLEPGAYVFDPFCGSGTTLLEAAHIGWNSVGIDLNPLGVLIANAKITAFNATPAVLTRECDALTRRLSLVSQGSDWRKHLPEPDYLQKWFPARVLCQLRAILRAIEQTKPKPLQDVFRVVLSDICRKVSLQDPDDLRIRRRRDPADDYPAIGLFLDAMKMKVSSVVRARQHIEPKKDTAQLAILGDTREGASVVRQWLADRGRAAFDAAITSPPYATAMPYLDTQRLSLALFGLIGSRDLRDGEKTLIGNREIAEKERLDVEAQVTRNLMSLPGPVISFCRHLLERADDPSHGFRRKNVPALTYKYFADMASMFASVRMVMKPAARFALLVGRNATTLRGEEILIDTPQLLAQVAESRGWQVDEMFPFEAYHRFDMHQSNSIREEVLVILRPN